MLASCHFFPPPLPAAFKACTSAIAVVQLFRTHGHAGLHRDVVVVFLAPWVGLACIMTFRLTFPPTPFPPFPLPFSFPTLNVSDILTECKPRRTRLRCITCLVMPQSRQCVELSLKRLAKLLDRFDSLDLAFNVLQSVWPGSWQ